MPLLRKTYSDREQPLGQGHASRSSKYSHKNNANKMIEGLPPCRAYLRPWQKNKLTNIGHIKTLDRVGGVKCPRGLAPLGDHRGDAHTKQSWPAHPPTIPAPTPAPNMPARTPTPHPPHLPLDVRAGIPGSPVRGTAGMRLRWRCVAEVGWQLEATWRAWSTSPIQPVMNEEECTLC